MNRKLVIVLLFMLAPLAGMGTDIFVPSLPFIAKDLGASQTLVQFTIAYYTLGYAIGQPLFGSLSDSFGRRIPLFVGLVLYIIVSFCITLATNIHVMLFLRLLQGFVVAGPGSISKAIRTDVFSGPKIAKLASAMSMTIALAIIVAPVLGGYFEEYFGWQLSFYFLTAYGGFVLLLGFFVLHETNLEKHPFTLKQVFKTYKTILTHKTFIGLMVCIAMISSIAVSFNVIGPFLIQTVMGYSPIDYGHFALFLGLGYLTGATVNRFLLHRFSMLQILPWTLYFAVLAAVAMVGFAWYFGVHILTLMLFTFLLLVSAGSIFPNTLTYCLNLFPKSAGTASACVGSAYVAGNAAIAFIASGLETSSLEPISLLFLSLTVLCIIVYLFLIPKKD